jgi:hypothetical protein
MKNYTRSTKLLGVFLVVLLSSFFKVDYTFAAPFEIVNTFEAPQDSSPNGLAWDGTYLWLSDCGAQDMIYKLTTNGEVVSSFAWPIEDDLQGPQGLTWDGEYLRIVSWSTRKVFKLTTEGVWVSEFAAPDPPNQSPRGITWDGSTLWLSDTGHWTEDPQIGSIYQLTTDGAIIFSFQLPSDFQTTRDLAYDGVNLWLAEQTGQMIHRISTSGEILESFDLWDDIGISGTPYGLTWDGSNLWVATKAAIYQLKPVQELQPSIEIILNQTTFATGEEIIVEAHLTNGPDPDRVEIKMWLENPDGRLRRIRHRPIIFLPPEADITKEIFRRTFTGDEPSGDWNVGGRLLNPINGDHKSIDIESFTFSP